VTAVRDDTFDVAVIGGGPAGIAAAVHASAGGARVALIDEGVSFGGQIWRPHHGEHRPRRARAWLGQLARSTVVQRSRTSVVDVRPTDEHFVIVTQSPPPSAPGAALGAVSDAAIVRARTVVIASGARERFLPFPGWTLPWVFGVGGAQALLEAGAMVRGKRVVVAGSGPLVMQVAASLARAGARLQLVAEQASAARVRAFARTLWARPDLLAQAALLRARFFGAPYLAGQWAVSASGDDRVRAVTLTDGARRRTVECDVLCTAFGLVPNVELARVLGCEVAGGRVVVDDFQRATVDGVYCAGEPTGVGGVNRSLVEGTIAGLAASGKVDAARRHLRRRARLRRYADSLDRAFALREELKSLPEPETIVCRCEDVRRGAIDPTWTPRQAKLYTRAGMGACQGRICGAALEWMCGWPADTVRPPVQPARVATLLAAGTAAARDADQADVLPDHDHGAH
jgi:thioredoxin reductase